MAVEQCNYVAVIPARKPLVPCVGETGHLACRQGCSMCLPFLGKWRSLNSGVPSLSWYS